MTKATPLVDIEINARPGKGLRVIRVYAETEQERELGLRALIAINDELQQIDDKLKEYGADNAHSYRE